MVAHIQAVAGDKAVHPRAQHEALYRRGEEDVEVGVFVLRAPRVLLREKGVERAAVHVETDMRLVVGAVGHQVGHELAEGRGLVAQPVAVEAVAASLGSLFHKELSFSLFSLYASISPSRRNCNKIFKGTPLSGSV